jgi:hypothetical protein
MYTLLMIPGSEKRQVKKLTSIELRRLTNIIYFRSFQNTLWETTATAAKPSSDEYLCTGRLIYRVNSCDAKRTTHAKPQAEISTSNEKKPHNCTCVTICALNAGDTAPVYVKRQKNSW